MANYYIKITSGEHWEEETFPCAKAAMAFIRPYLKLEAEAKAKVKEDDDSKKKAQDKDKSKEKKKEK